VEQEKEEKKVNEKELAELTRLNTERERIISQSNRMRYKGVTIDVVEQAKKDALDYIIALAKKYNFDPTKFGVDRITGVIRELPKNITGVNKKK
jgi:hypothetical protein